MTNSDTPDSGQLATMVQLAEAGDSAAKDALFTSLYAELHRLAESHIRRSGGQITMGATTLLHEAYLDLSAGRTAAFPDRTALSEVRLPGNARSGHRLRPKPTGTEAGGEITFTSVDEAMTQGDTVTPAWSSLGTRSTSSRPSITRSRSSST